MTATLDKQAGKVIYSREFTITPFIFGTFPFDKDRFCVTVIGEPNSPVLKRLFRYILNSCVDPDIVITSSADGLAEAKKAVSDCAQPDEKLRSKLVIADLSGTHQFRDLHPAVIDTSPTSGWLRDQTIRNILIPNTKQQTGTPGDWSKNYSHTIWLSPSLSDVPKVVLTNSHLTFITEVDQITEYLKAKIGSDFKVGSDIIFVVSSTLRQDIQLQTLPKSRFLSTQNHRYK